MRSVCLCASSWPVCSRLPPVDKMKRTMFEFMIAQDFAQMPQVAPLSPREAWRRRETWTASIAWAKELLASKERRHELCQQEFEKADANGGESLDRGEIMTVVKRICQEKFQLELPTDEKCNELFAKCDKNGDGSKAMKTESVDVLNHYLCEPTSLAASLAVHSASTQRVQLVLQVRARIGNPQSRAGA